MPVDDQERLRRWRLMLGKDASDLEGMQGASDIGMDKVLGALYDGEKSGDLSNSSPNVSRWLGDIRTYFPSSAVKVMQQDAMDRLNLTSLLLEPEVLASVECDIHMVTTLMTLSKVIPEETKDTARQVVRKVVQDLESKLRNPMMQAVQGSLNRATRTNRPRANEINWDRTIRANLKNYLPEKKTIIAERLVGYGRKRSSLRDIILCVDQSGSMGTSVVYSGIFGAVMASLKSVNTRMVVFDTAVVDLSEDLQDPVDLLFGVQLGGGTDINQALGYCQEQITRPNQTILVLITDLYEGGNQQQMMRRAAEMVASGVQVVCLLALSDKGAPSFDEKNATMLAGMGIPSFACTPDLFPDLMAAAIQRQDLGLWAARNDIVTARSNS